MKPTSSQLPQHRIEVVEPGQGVRRGWVTCEIDRHIVFDTARLESYYSKRWNPLVYDAFVVAAAVEYCDRTARRPQLWGRDISLRVPVHDQFRWRKAGIGSALATLTGDRWNVEFGPRKNNAEPSPQASLHMDSGARAVMPFSDGLDSYAVSCLMEREYGSLLRVRLNSRPPSPRQRLPFAGVPFGIRHSHFVERSFRARAFKFWVLAGVAAFLAQVEEVIVAESRQGILGPSLVCVGPEHEDVRTHPYFLDRMAEFLRKLFGAEVRYVYPRMWSTKAQTLTEYFDSHPGDEGWKTTRSCWQDQRHASVGGVRRQCGICSACLLRRMSLHAAGRPEGRSAYVWESLAAGSFCRGAAAEYKQRGHAMYDHFVHGATDLDELAKLHHSPSVKSMLVDRQVQRLCGSPSFGALDRSEIRLKVDRLLGQHANEWRAFKASLGTSSFLVRLLEPRSA